MTLPTETQTINMPDLQEISETIELPDLPTWRPGDVWTTNYETSYIKRCGTHNKYPGNGEAPMPNRDTPPEIRLRCLAGTILGARYRRNWGAINSRKVTYYMIDCLKHMLLRCERPVDIKHVTIETYRLVGEFIDLFDREREKAYKSLEIAFSRMKNCEWEGSDKRRSWAKKPLTKHAE